jgi:hypothetical protein
MNDEVNLADKLATFDEVCARSDEGVEILLIETRGTASTGDSGVEAAPEDEI